MFAEGDGLEPYRRLLTACQERLADDGALFLQLHRRVVGGARSGLPDVRAALERGEALVRADLAA